MLQKILFIKIKNALLKAVDKKKKKEPIIK